MTTHGRVPWSPVFVVVCFEILASTSVCARIIWSWTIDNLENMLQGIILMHTTPGTCLLYSPGAMCISNTSWSIICFRPFFHFIIMVQDHMVLEHMVNIMSDYYREPYFRTTEQRTTERSLN